MIAEQVLSESVDRLIAIDPHEQNNTLVRRLRADGSAISIEAADKIESLRMRGKHWEKEARAARRKHIKPNRLSGIEKLNEIDALQNFHDFFRDRCEGLFFLFGMPAIEHYNAAFRARRLKANI